VRAPVAIVLVFLVLLAAGLVGFSPLALDFFTGTPGYWERLSFIGQTYGAASALLSVVAIIGVVATLSYQAREVKISREEARRSAISDLLKMAMHDPDFNECWGPTGLDEPFKDQRQHMYVNMILSEWQMSFETGALGEKRLRAISGELFRGRIGRKFWEDAREVRLATTENRKARRFHEVLDEAYHDTKDLPLPPEPQSEPVQSPRDQSRAQWRSAVLGAVTGALAAMFLRWLFDRRGGVGS
jgi:hypothetical protein